MAKVIHGGGSNEQLVVSTDKTQAYGLSGDDTIISGGNSNVLLIGGSGDDSLVMMGGIGTLNGGAGKDTFELTYSAVNSLSAVIEDFDPSSDKIVINFDGASAPQLSSSSLSNGDVLWQDADGLFNLTLKSKRENDYFDGTGNAENDDRFFEVLRLTNNERENPTTVAPDRSDYSNESEYNKAFDKYNAELEQQKQLVDDARKKALNNALPWLTLSEGLTTGAATRAEEIKELAQTGELSNHKRLDGTDYFTVEVGENLSLSAKYSTFGENLEAVAKSPEEVVEKWIGSLSHHENLLKETYTKLGVGYVYDNSSKEIYYWTQLFAGSLASVSSISLEGLSIPQVNAVSKVVMLSDDADTYNNTDYGATINALDGNDFISNTGAFVSIAGGSGADTIDNTGANATISAGTGDDSIQLGSDNLIEYRAGDGSDTVSGFDATSRLSIIGDVEYMPVTVGNDVIVSVGGGSITLLDAAGFSAVIDGMRSKLYIGTDSANNYNNTIDGATIAALDGNDTIANSGASVSIDAGDGNDTVNNSGDFATISAGTGNDSIVNSGASVLFVYDSGNDTIKGFNETSTLRLSEGNYSTVAIGDDLIIKGATDSIKLLDVAGLSTLNIVDADGNSVEFGNARDIIRTDEDDTIDNPLDDATIQALGGDDTITNSGDNVIINAGAGNDNIINSGASVLFVYDSGDDTIQGFRADSTLQIAGDDGSSLLSNNDLILTLNTGSITLSGVAGLSTFNIVNANGSPIELRDARNIVGTETADDIDNTIDGATITALDGDDTIINSGNNVSISASAGDDSVDNSGASVSIDAGDGDDTITNNAANVTILGGKGDNQVQNNQQKRTVYVYGGGNDIIEGFADTDSLIINGYEWNSITSDGDFIVNITKDSATVSSITLKDYSAEPNIKSDYYPPNPGNDINNYTNATIVSGTAGDDSISNGGSNVTIEALAGNDSINNWLGDSSSINCGVGDDNVVNHGKRTLIEGGSGNDSIACWIIDDDDAVDSSSYMTIRGGMGDDFIDNHGHHALIEGGDGNDTLHNYTGDDGGIHEDYEADYSTLLGGTGDDEIDNRGDNVTIDGGVGDDYIYNGGNNSTILGGDGDDTISNSSLGSNVSINGGTGKDSISNYGDSVTIVGGDGNDSIKNDYGNSVTINTGDGDDFIYNEYGDSVTINTGDGDDSISIAADARDNAVNAGAGNDTLNTEGDNSYVNGGTGNDYVHNLGDSVTVDGSAGNDKITNSANYSTLNGGADDDTIQNDGGSNVSILGGTGNDSIVNDKGDSVTIDGGAGDDDIFNEGSNVSIDGGAGNDTIYNNYGSYVSISSGAGNDQISLSADSKNNFIRYDNGDGDDTVWGSTENDTINIRADPSQVSKRENPKGTNDLLIKVGTGSILLVGAWEKPPHIIIGASGTSGGGSGGDNGGGSSGGGNQGGDNDGGSSGGGNQGGNNNSGNNNGNNNGGNNNGNNNSGNNNGNNNSGNNSGNNNSGNNSGNNNSGNQGSETSGGTSKDANNSDNDATQSQSATGSSGRGISSGRGTSTGIGNSSGNGNRGNINTGGGYSSRGYNSTDYRRSTNASTPFEVNPFELLKIEARNANQNASTSGNQYIYAGYNQVIDNYQAGEKIFFLTDYTGAFYDGAGNFFFGSSTGALVVQNATDKFIEHYDGNGNSFLKAYAASTAGVIDGRWTTGFEVLNGSAGSDVIFAGDGGSQLLGGADVVSDTLVGGNGADTFVIGKNQGADIVLNASSADVVNLSDVTANDIIATAENDGAITVAFNTGNAIAVQSSEALSATFMLADGSAYRYNHAAKTWQSVNQNIYAGGDQVISNYQSGDKIVFGAEYTGATFDGAGNFLASSTTGTLIVQNAVDKVIDLMDGAGNSFLKAYEATTAGVIDGRGLTGFEVFNGSAGSDAIFAGDNGSQLWGGADVVSDTLVGGLGVDVFVTGKAQGTDTFLNTSSADVVHLSDVTLSDLVGSSEDNGTIAVAFNTGNFVTAQSSEALSAKFIMADGSAYRYNHANKSWQTA